MIKLPELTKTIIDYINLIKPVFSQEGGGVAIKKCVPGAS